jgi:hypothetical protein
MTEMTVAGSTDVPKKNAMAGQLEPMVGRGMVGNIPPNRTYEN